MKLLNKLNIFSLLLLLNIYLIGLYLVSEIFLVKYFYYIITIIIVILCFWVYFSNNWLEFKMKFIYLVIIMFLELIHVFLIYLFKF